MKVQNSLKNHNKSYFKSTQKSLINPLFIPSHSGILNLSQSQTTCFTFLREKGLTNGKYNEYMKLNFVFFEKIHLIKEKHPFDINFRS